jgi:hypothetical protein
MIWPLLIVTTTGLVLAGVLAAGPRLFRGTRFMTTGFRCPFRDRVVSVDFVETVWEGTRVDVARCSAFAPPTAVACEKRCLERSA